MHWLPPGETIGDMFNTSATGMTPLPDENLPEDVLKQHKHFATLLAVANHHFSRCESVSALLHTLEAAAHSPNPTSHGWALDGPRNMRGAEGHAPQQGAPAADGMYELERETCRMVLSDLYRCEFSHACRICMNLPTERVFSYSCQTALQNSVCSLVAYPLGYS